MRRFDRISIATSLVVSLALHVAALLPLLQALLADPGFAPHMQSRFDPEDFRHPDDPSEPPPPPEVEIGIDARTPSTLTWVGYEEYREHLARLAEVEQAAFTQDRPIGSERQAVAAAPPETAETTEPMTPAPAEPAAALEIPIESSITALRAMVDRLMVAATQSGDGRTPAEATPSPASRDAEEPADQPEENAPPPRPATVAGEKDPDIGDPSDRESDPTSIIEAPLDEIILGEPISRPGLELKPQRPRFDTLTRLTAFPGNPLTEIRFGPGGVPVDAEVVRSSGDKRVDHAVEASLFRWRASGARVADLAEGETCDVQILIVLRR